MVRDLVVGFAVGAWVASAVVGRPETPPAAIPVTASQPDVPPARASTAGSKTPTPSASSCGELQTKVHNLQKELERVALVASLTGDDLTEAIEEIEKSKGQPRPFVNTMEAPLTPELVEKAMPDVFREIGFAAPRVDCSEFPCMTFGTFTGTQQDLVRKLSSARSFALWKDLAKWVRFAPNEDGSTSFALAITGVPFWRFDHSGNGGLELRMRMRANEGLSSAKTEPQ
jgi:hypothetical protein